MPCETTRRPGHCHPCRRKPVQKAEALPKRNGACGAGRSMKLGSTTFTFSVGLRMCRHRRAHAFSAYQRRACGVVAVCLPRVEFPTNGGQRLAVCWVLRPLVLVRGDVPQSRVPSDAVVERLRCARRCSPPPPRGWRRPRREPAPSSGSRTTTPPARCPSRPHASSCCTRSLPPTDAAGNARRRTGSHGPSAPTNPETKTP